MTRPSPAGSAPAGQGSPLREIDETDVSTEQSSTQADARLPCPYGDARRPPDSEAPPRQRPQASDGVDPAQTTALTPRPARVRFPKAARVRRRGEFLRVQRVGRRKSGAHFVVLTTPARAGRSRLGITVSRRVGDAVARNRIKRLVREFFRHNQARIHPAQDVVVIARPGASDANYPDVQRELQTALKIEHGA